MTGDELAALLAEDAVTVVDVRTRPEFEGAAGYPCDRSQGHIPGAIHVELDELLAASREEVGALLEARGAAPGLRLVLYCHSGSRSGVAAAALRAAGLDAENYAGSWHEWSRR